MGVQEGDTIAVVGVDAIEEGFPPVATPQECAGEIHPVLGNHDHPDYVGVFDIEVDLIDDLPVSPHTGLMYARGIYLSQFIPPLYADVKLKGLFTGHTE
jgi:hypothetical protein